MLTVRPLSPTDLHAANTVCISAFMASVAPTLAEEGINTFLAIAATEAFAARMAQDNLILIAERGEQAAGLIELKQGRHLAMLFVAPDQQRQGVGRQLLAAVLPHVRGELLTVSAALPSVSAYLDYGFECCGDIGQSAGLTYQPMQLHLPPPSLASAATMS